MKTTNFIQELAMSCGNCNHLDLHQGKIIPERDPKQCGGAKGYCNIGGGDDDDDDDGEVHDDDGDDDDDDDVVDDDDDMMK